MVTNSPYYHDLFWIFFTLFLVDSIKNGISIAPRIIGLFPFVVVFDVFFDIIVYFLCIFGLFLDDIIVYLSIFFHIFVDIEVRFCNSFQFLWQNPPSMMSFFGSIYGSKGSDRAFIARFRTFWGRFGRFFGHYHIQFLR